MRGPWLVGVALGTLLAAFDAAASILIHPSATTRLEERVSFDLVVTNAGDETARYIVPEVAFQGETKRGDLLTALVGGEQHGWQFALGPPSSPGAFPLIARVRYADTRGRALSTVLVDVVRTPDCPAAPVHLTFPPPSHIFIDRFALVRLLLENPGPAPLAGRIVTVLPTELRVQPESPQETIPAQGRIEVPLVFENTGGATGDVSDVYVVFEYDLDGFHHAVAEGSPITVIDLSPIAANSWGPVLVIVGLLAAVAGLGLFFYFTDRPPWKRRRPAKWA